MKNKHYLFLIIFSLIFVTIVSFLDQYNANSLISEKEKIFLNSIDTIIYSSNDSVAPLSFFDTEDGQYKGIQADYVNLISLELGKDFDFIASSYSDIYEKLETGDVHITDLVASNKNSESYIFSDPIYNLKGILVLKDKKLSNDKLNNNIIAVQKSSFANEFILKKDSQINIKEVNNIEQAIKLLVDGKIDGILGDEPVLLYYIQKYNLNPNIYICKETIYEYPVVFAIHKNMENLVPIINKSIKSLNSRNMLEQIQQRWFGISTPITIPTSTYKVRMYLTTIFLLISLGLVAMSFWNKTLQNKILIKTNELSNSKKDLEIVFDSMSEFMLVVDKNKKIKNINKSLLYFLGNFYKSIGKDSILGKNINKIEFIKNLELDNIIDFKIAKSNIEKTYNSKIYEINSYPLVSNEEFSGVLILIYDITAKKIQDNNLLQTNKMIAIGELAAGIAHEIRNPLGIIRNHSFIMKSNENLDKTALKSLEFIDRAIIRASKIVDNILNFSRISNEEYEYINLKDLISSILDLQSKEITENNINVIINIDSSLTIYSSTESLKHIFINLISNSISAINEKSLKKGYISISGKKIEKGFCITIYDSGTGIIDDDLDRIYNPFYTSKEPGKGTGLGLYIAYNEVKKLKGDISVISKKNLGTSFTIEFPQEVI